jgi:hypothetical protein
MDFDGLPIFRGFSGILVAFLVAGILLGSNCDFVRAGAKQQGVTPVPDLLARPISAYAARPRSDMPAHAPRSPGAPDRWSHHRACRHPVKVRMERTGMRWIPSGAQAMLDL